MGEIFDIRQSSSPIKSNSDEEQKHFTIISNGETVSIVLRIFHMYHTEANVSFIDSAEDYCPTTQC